MIRRMLFPALTAVLLLLVISPAMAQTEKVLQVATHITEVNYAEGTMDALTDNGYFGTPYVDTAVSLYLETAHRNRFPVVIHYVKVMGEEGHWYGDIKKIVSKEMGALAIDENGSYIDNETKIPDQIQVEAPDPDYIKKPQSVTTTITGTRIEFIEGEWFEMETTHSTYNFFGVFKDEFDPRAFQKLESVVNTAINDKSEVTFHFLKAPKTGLTLTKIEFKGHGTFKIR